MSSGVKNNDEREKLKKKEQPEGEEVKKEL